MATRRVITVRENSVGMGPPGQRWMRNPSQAPVLSKTKFERAKEARQVTLSDAEIAVQWLNASRRTRSNERVVFIRRELEALQSEWADHSSTPPWLRPTRPGVNNRDEFDKVHRQLEERHRSLNEMLGRYVFRPRVTHSVFVGTWHFGMVPDDNRQSYSTKIGDRTIAEADAVMAMVRLDSTGDLGQVHLCEMCQQEWHVAAKRSYRFCSDVCRTNFYGSRIITRRKLKFRADTEQG